MNNEKHSSTKKKTPTKRRTKKKKWKEIIVNQNHHKYIDRFVFKANNITTKLKRNQQQQHLFGLGLNLTTIICISLFFDSFKLWNAHLILFWLIYEKKKQKQQQHTHKTDTSIWNLFFLAQQVAIPNSIDYEFIVSC